MDDSGDILNMPQMSRTVASLESYPNSVCTHCRSAVWHITEAQNLRVYCRLMHSLVDENLIACDGSQEIQSN